MYIHFFSVLYKVWRPNYLGRLSYWVAKGINDVEAGDGEYKKGKMKGQRGCSLTG